MRKLGPVTIDPRRHDAVLFDTTLDATQELVRQLQEVGVGTGVFVGRPHPRRTPAPRHGAACR